MEQLRLNLASELRCPCPATKVGHYRDFSRASHVRVLIPPSVPVFDPLPLSKLLVPLLGPHNDQHIVLYITTRFPEAFQANSTVSFPGDEWSCGMIFQDGVNLDFVDYRERSTLASPIPLIQVEYNLRLVRDTCA